MGSFILYRASIHHILLIFFFFCDATPQIWIWQPRCSAFYITHTHTQGRQDSPERVISPSQRPPPTQNTTNTTDKHPYHQRDSNPRSQQSSGFRPTLYTAGTPVMAPHVTIIVKMRTRLVKRLAGIQFFPRTKF